MKIEAVRRFALALPGASEAPHFDYGSFRVGTKIFATFPPGDTHLPVFVDDDEREKALELHPRFIEKLWWGKKVVGLRIALAKADAAVVKALVRSSFEKRTRPKPRAPRKARA